MNLNVLLHFFIYILTIYLCSSWDSYDLAFVRKKGFSLYGNPVATYQTDSFSRCSIYCRNTVNCTGMVLAVNVCKLYVVSAATLIYNPSSQVSIGHLLMAELVKPRNLPMDNEIGYWGVWTNFQYCDPMAGVAEVNIWYDYYDNTTMSPDDKGISQIEIVCESLSGKAANTIKEGVFESAAALKSFRCPAASFVTAVRFMLMDVQSATVDDASMVGFSAMCNDVNNTTKDLSSGEGVLPVYGSLTFGPWYFCDPGFALCGFTLRVEYPSDCGADCSYINAMRISCCLIV